MAGAKRAEGSRRCSQRSQGQTIGADYRVHGGGVGLYSTGGGKLGFEKKPNNIILHALLYQMSIPMRGEESYPHFTSEEAEALRVKMTFSTLIGKMRQFRGG